MYIIISGSNSAYLHNSVSPALNNYPRPSLVRRLNAIVLFQSFKYGTLCILQVGYDSHSAMRGALGPAALAGIPGGKP